jgi:hypothetical protein
MKTVFIAHPVAGDIQGNIEKILAICKQVHNKDIVPVAPYLVSLQYLNDNATEDREPGIDANLETFHRKYIDELWLYGDRISKGMEQEVKLAFELDIPVIPQTEGTKRDLTAFLSTLGGFNQDMFVVK